MKPRVLFITPLPPPIHGSAMVSQYIKDSQLLKNNFHCDFINLSTSRKMEEIGKPNIRKVLRFCSIYVILLWKLICHKYDLCYLAITCHGIGFLKDFPFILLCKIFRRKIVIHQHNKGMKTDVNRWPYSWLLPFAYHNTKVILLSWHLYPDIEDVVKKEQIMICPNGIPEILESNNIPKRNNIIPKLLFLSNLIPSKGVYVLLDACKILKEKGLQFICNFIGGETKEISRELFEIEVHKRGLDNSVFYLGAKYGTDKHKMFENTDIFVFPTYYENEAFSLVLLEAMQYRIPIVTTTEGGIPDIVIDGQNGFLIHQKDSHHLATALEKLLCDPILRENMGIAGQEKYKGLFTLNHFEKNIVCCIRNCLTRNK